MRDTNIDQAVVLGGSMAGLLAARELSERFNRVVVIERDALPPIGEHCRGVPHGRHIHVPQSRGLEILNELFPGFSTSLATRGAMLCNILGDTRWQMSGSQLRQTRPGPAGLSCSRPFLEGHVRAMVQRLPEVRFLQESSIDQLTASADKRVVTSVQVRGPDIATDVADADPLDDPVPFRFPASVRRRYKRVTTFPARLLVIGDAICSFNPIYAQGMTIAVTEARVLRQHTGSKRSAQVDIRQCQLPAVEGVADEQ